MAVVGALGLTLALADEDLFATDKGTRQLVLPTAIPTGSTQSLVPPSNDECAGALFIPDGATGSGDYPVCSPITTGVQEATPDCSAPSATDPGSCLAAGQHIANTVWYTWSPATTQFYNVFACPFGGCVPGGTHTDDSDGVIAMYTSAGGCAGPFTLVACNDDGCGGAAPSKFGPVLLNGGQTYFFMVGNWTNTNCATAGLIDNYELRIEVAAPPANDVCGSATPLLLDSPEFGVMNALTNNDYTVPAACYTTAGQIPSTQVVTAGVGRDVVYAFTAPDEGDFSFYLEHYSSGDSTTTGPDPLLYTTSDCPSGGPVGACLYAANRAAPVAATANPATNRNGASEENLCLHLTAGQLVYVYVDETAASATDTTFRIHARRCVLELEFNGTPAGAEDPGGDGSLPPNGAFRGCPVEGQIFTFPGFPDIDFYTLGAPAAGSRLFSAADCDGANPRNDGVAGTSANLDMRLTNATDTLEFDDADLATFYGNFCPSITGAPMTGATSYLRINHATATASLEPYRLHTIIRAAGSESPEPPEPNDASLMIGDYIAGSHLVAQDFDYYAFCARKGDQIMVNADSDPSRNADANNLGTRQFFLLFDSGGNAIPVAGFGVSAAATSVSTPSPGTLTGVSPRFGGDTLIDIATRTDFYFAGALEASLAGLPVTLGDYLYQSSLNCGPIRADLGITKTGPATAAAGSDVTYTIVVTNNGPNPALVAGFQDLLPPGSTLVGFTAPDGWDCFEDSGSLFCQTLDTCYDGVGGSAEFTVTVNVAACSGNFTLSNIVGVSSLTADDNSSNDIAFWDVTITDDGSCEDGLFCTSGDTCSGGVCVGGGPNECSDDNDCTDDACDEDANACVYTPDDTNSCSDDNACTLVDACVGGSCVGSSPPNCNDGNNCTDDTCDPILGCVNSCNGTCDGNVKGFGWWKRLCRGPHPSGEFISDVDVACVNDTCTFGSVGSVGDICDRLTPNPVNDKCEQAEADFMALVLNTCRCRAAASQPIDSHCGGNSVVGAIVPAVDALLCNPARDHDDCVSAICSSNEISTGSALWANTLRLNRIAINSVELVWTAPFANPDGSSVNVTQYRIWRRASSEAPFEMIGQVNGNTLTFVDATANGENLQYEVTARW